jgi:hypothetical protein
MTAERAIHLLIFVLLLLGLWTVSAWASYTYLISNNIVLAIAGIPLGWGIILLVLYVAKHNLRKNSWNKQKRQRSFTG